MNNPMDLEPAAAARLVKREVPATDKEGKPTGKMQRVPIEAGEVFAVRVRDGDVTVITTAGERLTGTLPPAKGTGAGDGGTKP